MTRDIRRRHARCLAVLLAVSTVMNFGGRGRAAQERDERVESAIAKATAWLIAQQAADGGWHSAVYGQMRGGAGNTALVVHALARTPIAARTRIQLQLERGLDFLLAKLHDSGYVRAPNASADYPNYATALTLGAINRLGDGKRVDEHRKLRDYLLAAQQMARLPWESGDDNIGGWGLVGGVPSDLSSYRDANISTTRLVLQSLGPTPEAAIDYVSRLQNHDGGFRFAADPEDPLNKAGVAVAADNSGDPPAARSYGSATADGLCALLKCGVPKTDARVQSAVAWLDRHNEVGVVPGFPEANAGVVSARDGLKFYFAASLARAMELVPDAEFCERRGGLIEQLLREQRADGSWINRSPLMREDDPLIATAWVIEALSILSDIAAQRPPDLRKSSP